MTRKVLTLPLTLMALAGALALSACGHSDSADAVASSDNVEMPAEEALSGLAATPAADPSATATAGADSIPMPPAAPAAPAATSSSEPDKD